MVTAEMSNKWIAYSDPGVFGISKGCALPLATMMHYNYANVFCFNAVSKPLSPMPG